MSRRCKRMVEAGRALPWQQPVLAHIRSALAQGRLPSAIAMICPAGWGLTALAEHVVQLVVELDADQNPAEIAHQDVRWVEPDGSVIKIDQIRRVNEFAVQTVQVAPRKAVLLLHADRLNANAANALLKTLEEPPRDTHIILASESWGKLLPTIRSRCQRFVVRPDTAAAMAWLAGRGSRSTESKGAGKSVKNEDVQQEVDVNHQHFAESGYAPLTYSSEATPLEMLIGKADSATVAALLKNEDIEPTEILSRWYRHVVAQVASALIANNRVQAQGLLQFADRILDVRRQLISTNAANQTLLFEALMQRYRSLA